MATKPESQQLRIRNAANRALMAYPGVVGKVLYDELSAYAENSWLWSNGRTCTRMNALIDEVMGQPIPVRA